MLASLREWLFGPSQTKDTWATAATPDEIIAAKVVQDMAKDQLEGWGKKDRDILDYERRRSIKSDGLMLPGSYPRGGYRWIIRNADESWKIEWEDYGYGSPSPDNFHVNDVPLDKMAGREIVDAFTKLKEAKDRAAAVKRKAIQTMQENEQKWNLVEEKLGMVRTPEGALIPKITVE